MVKALFLAINILGIFLLASCQNPANNPSNKSNKIFITDPSVVNSKDVPAGYGLVWHDEFTGSGLPDSSKWTYETWGNSIGWGNGEIQQYLVADADNAYQATGKLNIVAKKEPVPGWTWDYDLNRSVPETYNYSSARLTTYFDSADNPNYRERTYGFIEVRAKIPGVGGTWPAIWLAGRSYQWPKGGEIDVMEQWGTDPNIGGNFHTYWSHNPFQELIHHYMPLDVFTTFHNYQLLWTPSKLTIMVDGYVVNTYEKNTNLTGDAAINQWPFDTPQDLIINNAIQGKGVVVDDTNVSKPFQIDYVRWYQSK